MNGTKISSLTPLLLFEQNSCFSSMLVVALCRSVFCIRRSLRRSLSSMPLIIIDCNHRLQYIQIQCESAQFSLPLHPSSSHSTHATVMGGKSLPLTFPLDPNMDNILSRERRFHQVHHHGSNANVVYAATFDRPTENDNRPQTREYMNRLEYHELNKDTSALTPFSLFERNSCFSSM
jgi:hypothetical protein